MENRNYTYNIEDMVEKMDKNKLTFDYAIQRDSGQWSKEQKQLLIDTIIHGYIIPEVYIIKEGTEAFSPMSVLDGKQRLTTIHEFIHDKFKLPKDMEDVVLTDISYDENGKMIKTETVHKVAGKCFSKLDKEIQNIILKYKINVKLLAGYTDEQIEDQFYRLNNGSLFTKPQKANVKLGTELAEKFSEITNNNFFKYKAQFSARQEKAAEPLSCVLQTMMLLTGFDYKGLSNNEVLRYADFLGQEYEANRFSLKQIEYCSYLFNRFYAIIHSNPDTESSIKKIHIPTLIMNMETMESLENDGKITESQYKEFLDWWFSEGIFSEEYLDTCGAGSVGKLKTEERINVMEKALIDFITKHYPDTDSDVCVGNNSKDFIEQNCTERPECSIGIGNDFEQHRSEYKGTNNEEGGEKKEGVESEHVPSDSIIDTNNEEELNTYEKEFIYHYRTESSNI